MVEYSVEEKQLQVKARVLKLKSDEYEATVLYIDTNDDGNAEEIRIDAVVSEWGYRINIVDLDTVCTYIIEKYCVMPGICDGGYSIVAHGVIECEETPEFMWRDYYEDAEGVLEALNYMRSFVESDKEAEKAIEKVSNTINTMINT
jgi:hypothetical protein